MNQIGASVFLSTEGEVPRKRRRANVNLSACGGVPSVTTSSPQGERVVQLMNANQSNDDSAQSFVGQSKYANHACFADDAPVHSGGDNPAVHGKIVNQFDDDSSTPRRRARGKKSSGQYLVTGREGGEAQGGCDNHGTVDLSPLIRELQQLQKIRKFCIKIQGKLDRSVESLIATMWGFNPGDEEESRKKFWNKVSATRKAVEKGGGQAVSDGQLIPAPTEIILMNAANRQPWDAMRERTEKRMREIAMQLPVWPWVESVRGFGAIGLAIIIGETGDLTPSEGFRGYATKERVWKRLGLAVMDGFRQGDPKRPDVSKESWIEHAYNKQRRAEIWTIADSMFRHQWRGEKEVDGIVTAAHALGPYGEVYAKRRAHTEARDWSPGRKKNDAVRIMTKALIADLWRAWRKVRGIGV